MDILYVPPIDKELMATRKPVSSFLLYIRLHLRNRADPFHSSQLLIDNERDIRNMLYAELLENR